jgi:beta-N-acetylhexosaminidase
MSAAGNVIVGALEGTEITPEEVSLLCRAKLAGITLFKRNITPAFSQDLRTLNQRVQGLRPAGNPPLIVAIDQEGGRVSRLPPPFPDAGPAFHLFESLAPAARATAIEQYAWGVGTCLVGLGVNVNFAPCADIITNAQNTAIGDRAFADNAPTVTLLAGAFLEGLRNAGVAGCLKHFPGQGDASADTHTAGATIPLSRADLERRELVPFMNLLAMAPMVMMSHCTYPAFDTKQASLSKVIMQDLIRNELNYKGLIVSDDMNMEAISQDLKSWCEAIEGALAAGADLILVCRKVDRMVAAEEHLNKVARRSPAFREILEHRAQNVWATRTKLAIA